MASNPYKVLLIRTGRIGDILFAIAVMDALKKFLNRPCEFDWLIRPMCKNLFTYVTYADSVKNIYTIHKQRKFPVWLSPTKRRIIKKSKLNPYDLVVNMETASFLNTFMKSVKSRKKVGLPFSSVKISPDEHEVIAHCKVLSPLGYQYEKTGGIPKLSVENCPEVQHKFNLPREYIVLSMATSNTKKRRVVARSWPISHWKKLINHLSTMNKVVVLVGRKSEETILDKINPIPKGVINLFGKTNLDELITVIKNAKSIVTTDTGSSHIASAVKTPVVVIFGPSSYKKTSPFQYKDNIVCILSIFKKNDFTPYLPAHDPNMSMSKITPAMVVSALTHLNLI